MKWVSHIYIICVSWKLAHSHAGEEKDKEKAKGNQEQQTQKLEYDKFGILVALKSHHIKFKQSLFSMYEEWFGIHSSKDKPIEGGLEVLETPIKSKWRKHFVPSKEKAFS